MTALLAEIPGPGVHFSLVKIGVFAVLFVGWAYACQWVDHDTDFVKTKREQWNLIVLSGGVAGLAVLLLMPWGGAGLFMLGLAFWLLLAGGAVMVYVVHRNGRVVPKHRVMTPSHLKRLLSGGEKVKKREDKGQRVKVADKAGKQVDVPEDSEEYDRYAAVQEFLFDVMWRRGTDADMLIGKSKARLVYRIDGVAAEQEDRLSLEDAERVLVYLKGLAGLNPEERRRPQSGQIRAGLLASADLSQIEVQTSGTTAGERLRLKILAPESSKRLSELGLHKLHHDKLKELIEKRTGLVIFSGPKQSGVTTTQYGVMRDHDAFMQNLHTLESRPLLELDNITQNEHNAGGDVSYARHLQTVLRREPDVVLVGECDDRETGEIACRAAAGERKVYLALEAKGACEALEKIRQLVGDDKLVAKSLLGVTNQRLIRILCSACRQAFKPDENLLRKLNLPVGKIEYFHRPPTEPILDKKGREIVCQTCQGTGYVGRTGLYEVLAVDEAVRKLVAGGESLQRIRAHCRQARMHDLWRAGLQKVFEGVTSLDEILRALGKDRKAPAPVREKA